MAAQEVAGRYAHWGYWTEALILTEEAVQLYRELASTNPAFLPDLADSAEQPRRPLQRGGAPPGRAGSHRGSGPDLPRAGRH